MNGILIVNKGANVTSRDVVNDLVHIFHTKKIGHTGTLDPLATGVLVCTIGKYTKLNLDLTSELSKIKCPTLLIWGTNDTAVPYSDAVELEKLVSNCGLVTYEGCTHYAYLERLDQTIRVLNSFIGIDEK